MMKIYILQHGKRWHVETEDAPLSKHRSLENAIKAGKKFARKRGYAPEDETFIYFGVASTDRGWIPVPSNYTEFDGFDRDKASDLAWEGAERKADKYSGDWVIFLVEAFGAR